MALSDRLRAVFVDTLELGDDVDVEKLQYRDIEQWDSLGHMTLVGAIEDEFGVQLDTEQVIDMSSFKVALDMLSGMGVHD
ncbi:acyl carrier protein [Micromonospora sp. SL1-18]|uniref:acyl carrier protein n=1 Tax=Micromonospora sp. SL1-18 TaxID=3399128 RepID=UPI003A4D82C4